jgi:hypothetical protein
MLPNPAACIAATFIPVKPWTPKAPIMPGI